MTMEVDSDALEGKVADGIEVEAEIIDDDPIVAAMKEAEAEIAKEEAEGKGRTPEGQQAQAVNDPAPKAENQGGDEGQGDKPANIMIPKARFDEKVSEAARERSRGDYLAGIVETQRQMLATMKGGQQAPDQSGQTTQGENGDSAKPDFDTQIKTAEDQKLVIAQQYEDGEISFKDAQAKQIELDRQIRALSDDRTKALMEEAKASSVTVASELTLNARLEEVGREIQKNHPYVAEIDKLPQHRQQAIWNLISNEAVGNLVQKGYAVNNADPQYRMALMREKASLTDKYGPTLTGVQVQQPNGQHPQAQISDAAKARGEKIDLAAQHPPATAQAGYGADRQELTETDIANMTDDQVAELLAKSPHLVERAVGIR